MRIRSLSSALFVLLGALNYKLTKRRVPLMVSLSITNLCNINCPFCYFHDSRIKFQEYTTEVLLDYIDQFVSLGTRIFLLQGGEPMLRPDLKEIIAHIKKKGSFCRISTNGVLVAERIDALSQIDQISFSLDGDQEVADKIRGRGVYQKVVEGMNRAYEKKIPFEIHASLIRESITNKDSLYHLLGLAKKYKTSVSFCVSCVSGAQNTREVGSADLSPQEIKDFYRFLISLKKQGYPISNSLNSLRKTLEWPISYSQIGFPQNLPRHFRFISCRHGRLICWLGAHHTLLPCPIAFSRKEYEVSISDRNIKKVKCVACSGSDESTSFFALKPEDIIQAARVYFRDHLIREG